MSRSPEAPLALGFLALAAATVLISSIELEWVFDPGRRLVAIALVALTAPLQLTVAGLAFARRDAVARTGMAVLSAAWLTIGLVMLSTPLNVGHRALGIFLLVAAGVLVVPDTAAAVARRLPALVLFAASVRLGLAGLDSLTGGGAAGVVGGLAGLAFTFPLARQVGPQGRRND